MLQTWWLKIVAAYSLPALEARSLNHGVSRAMLSLKALGGDSSFLLPVYGGGWQSLAGRCITPVSASAVTWCFLCVSLCLCPNSSFYRALFL